MILNKMSPGAAATASRALADLTIPETIAPKPADVNDNPLGMAPETHNIAFVTFCDVAHSLCNAGALVSDMAIVRLRTAVLASGADAEARSDSRRV